MNPAERNYKTHDAELLTIVEAFKHGRHYLIYSKHEILVLTDHHNFQAFMKTTKFLGRQIKWVQKLVVYDFVINDRIEKRNSANELFRRFDYLKFDANAAEANRRCLHEFQQFFRKKLRPDNLLSIGSGTTISDRKDRGISDDEMKFQMPCHELFEISKKLRFDIRLTSSMKNVNKCILVAGTSMLNKIMKSAKTAIANDALKAEDVELLFKKIAKMLGRNSLAIALKSASNLPHFWSEGENGILMHFKKIYVPEALRTEAIRLYHDDKRAGHYEVQKTLKLVLRNYYWSGPIEIKKLIKKLIQNGLNLEENLKDFLSKGMKVKIKKYIKHCVICRRSKALKHKFYDELTNLPVPEAKWANIILNFVEGLSSNMNGNNVFYDAILMMVDRLTKMIHYVPITKNMSAIDLFEVLNKKMFKHYDLSDFIVSNRDFLITSKFGKNLIRVMKFDRKMSNAFHSQIDGQTKRQNSTMKQYLRAHVNFQQDDGVQGLSKAKFVYNNSMNIFIKMTFFFAMLGYHSRMSYEIKVKKFSNPTISEMVKRHQKILIFLKEQLAKAQKKQAFFVTRLTTDRL